VAPAPPPDKFAAGPGTPPPTYISVISSIKSDNLVGNHIGAGRRRRAEGAQMLGGGQWHGPCH